MAGRRDLRDKMASLFELPGDVMLDAARISVVGQQELLIENHRGVMEYTEERVVMGIPDGRVAIVGEGLAIASIAPDQVLILGQIRSIQYLE